MKKIVIKIKKEFDLDEIQSSILLGIYNSKEQSYDDPQEKCINHHIRPSSIMMGMDTNNRAFVHAFFKGLSELQALNLISDQIMSGSGQCFGLTFIGYEVVKELKKEKL